MFRRCRARRSQFASSGASGATAELSTEFAQALRAATGLAARIARYRPPRCASAANRAASPQPGANLAEQTANRPRCAAQRTTWPRRARLRESPRGRWGATAGSPWFAIGRARCAAATAARCKTESRNRN